MMTIANKCNVTETLPFTSLLPFQGNLKVSKSTEIEALADSLIDDGQATPFFVWQHDSANYVIDGHRRLLAIQHIATVHPEVLNASYPVVYVEAETIEEAKKQLLLMCSTYGKITPRGLEAFLIDVPTIQVDKIGIKVRTPTVKIKKQRVVNEYKVLKIRVHKTKAPELLRILMESGVEVL